MPGPWEDFQSPAPVEKGPWEDFSTEPTAAPTGKKHLGPDIEATVRAKVPGVNVTSGFRTPEHNKKVGGKWNSYHLTDDARDFTPPSGMTMSQLRGMITGDLPGFDVINEGDHVHAEPGPGGGGPLAVPTIRQNKPPETASTEETMPWEDYTPAGPTPRRDERGSFQNT